MIKDLVLYLRRYVCGRLSIQLVFVHYASAKGHILPKATSLSSVPILGSSRV